MNATTSTQTTQARLNVTYKTNGDKSTTARVTDAAGNVVAVHSNMNISRLYKLIRERYLSR